MRDELAFQSLDDPLQLASCKPLLRPGFVDIPEFIRNESIILCFSLKWSIQLWNFLVKQNTYLVFDIFTLFLVGDFIVGLNLNSTMFFILSVAGIIWNCCGNWMACLFLDIALGLVFFSIFNTRFVRSSWNFFAYFSELGFIDSVTFWSWLVIRSWRVIIFFTPSFFCKCKGN